MAKSYDEYEVDRLAAAKKQSDEYAAQRKAQADEAAKTSDGLYDTAIATAEKNYNASAEATADAYRQVYDTNAVSELVARRQVEEAMANMNLTDSGLNRTQQTAIALQRGRADSETTRQKQAAVDSIMRELDGVREKYNAEKTAASRSIYEQADADILAMRANADAAARQNAATLYAADQEYAASVYAADQERAAEEAKAQQEAVDKQAQYQLDMLKLGYVYDASAGGYVKQTEPQSTQLTTEQIKTVLAYMDETGEEDYDVAAQKLFGVTSKALQDQQTKAKTMSNPGTPSYVAIDTQAKLYAKSNAQQAYDYVEEQYKKGYITEQQKQTLQQKYGHKYIGEEEARKQIMGEPDFNKLGLSAQYEDYKSYVKERLAELYNDGKINDTDFLNLSTTFEVGL